MPDISDLIEDYKKDCKKMVPADQAKLVDTIVDLGLKIGVSIAQNLQAVQGTDTEVIQSAPEVPPAMPCRRHCVNMYKGQCMIFKEDEIAPDTHLCEGYEKYADRNQWGV